MQKLAFFKVHGGTSWKKPGLHPADATTLKTTISFGHPKVTSYSDCNSPSPADVRN